jgi:serine/threonine-protein kinase
MALVYRGHDDELERPVAVKLLADNLAADPSFRKRFVREARTAAQLTHPNVVQVYDAGEVDGRPYIVMEYVEGETLADLLERRGRLPAAEAVELALQVCAGLDHAHAAGLVHRDIKPQNLLLGSDGTVKVADFGIARSAHGTRLTETGSVLGTAAYLAPEQVAGEDVTAAADVYAVGVVIYQLLTGSTPYGAETLTELLLRQQQEEVRPLRELAPEVPAPLEYVVMRCLARVPAHRPPSAAALAEALASPPPELRTWPLTRSAPAGRPDAESEATIRLRRRRPRGTGAWKRAERRLAVAAVAAIVLLLGVLGAVALIEDDPGSSPPPTRPAADERSPAEQARDLAAWLRDNSE